MNKVTPSTWTHQGVEHALWSNGECMTCGKRHLNAEHRHTIDTYSGGTPCHMRAVHGGYPYDCERARKQPFALVVICESHGAWWTEEN